MIEFTPADAAEYEREAIKPFLELTSFMRKENWSSARTYSYVRSAESADKNWAIGLLCLQFRSGVTAFTSELWECYEGEGLGGLDERWDVGTAIMFQGINEDIIADVLGYVSESEAIVRNMTDYTATINLLREKFQQFVRKHQSDPVSSEE